MEKHQESAWAEAQMLDFSCDDLIKAAKQHVLFLAAVDRRRSLQVDGPVLERAIQRYMHCWLPLLDKHSDSNGMVKIKGSLLPPLDCEWVWHCHRLNPLQYKKDCDDVFGKTLNSQGVKSSIHETDDIEYSLESMVELWGNLYPEEAFEIDYDNYESYDGPPVTVSTSKAKTFDYDLADGVKRQSNIYYHVSRPSYFDNLFLEDALARYKGFLYLIKMNPKTRPFGVPVYDVDLLWHTHQLQPIAYANDTKRILGRLMGHDDTDTDKSETGKLRLGFHATTTKWEEMYGNMYWKSGAMSRGDKPAPLPIKPALFNNVGSAEAAVTSTPYLEKLKIQNVKVVEIILQVVDIKNAPDHEKGTLSVYFEKDPDLYVDGGYELQIQSEVDRKDVAVFECEPSGELQMTLKSKTTGDIGTFSVSLEHMMKPVLSELTIFKWFDVKLDSHENGEKKPISLLVALSSTVPVTAPHYLFMFESPPLSEDVDVDQQVAEKWYSFIDDSENEVIMVNMRSNKLVGIVEGSDETYLLAELMNGNIWSLIDSKIVLSLHNKINEDGHIFEFTAGPLQMKIFPGRRLEFEPKSGQKKREERDFVTVVGFSGEHPYGKPIALIDMETGHVKVNEDWFVVFGVLLTYILYNLLKEKGHNAFVPEAMAAVVENHGAESTENGMNED